MSFNILKLICPRCRRVGPKGELLISTIVEFNTQRPAVLGQLDKIHALQCSNQHCQALYPVLKGIPLIFSDPEAISLIHSPPIDLLSLPYITLKALLTASNPDSPLPTLMARLARYIRAGFSDWFTDDTSEDPLRALPPHAVQLMATLKPYETKNLASENIRLVLGSALGREAWEVTQNPTVLADAHLPSLLATKALLTTGILDFLEPDDVSNWSHHQLKTPIQPKTPVALICCDAQNPPFEAEQFASVIAPNLIDSVHDPLLMLGQAHALTKPGKLLTISSPFAWRTSITPRENWLEILAPRRNMSAPEVIMWFGKHRLQPAATLLDQSKLFWTLKNSEKERLLYQNVMMVLQVGTSS